MLKKNIMLSCALLLHSGVHASNMPQQAPSNYHSFHEPALLSYEQMMQQEQMRVSAHHEAIKRLNEEKENIDRARKQEAERASAAERKHKVDEWIARAAARKREYDEPQNQLVRGFATIIENAIPKSGKSEPERRHENYRVAKDMATDFLPMYVPGPVRQIMDDNDFEACKEMPKLLMGKLKERVALLNQENWNAMRIKVARWYTDSERGPFKSGASSCRKRCDDCCASGFYCAYKPAMCCVSLCDLLSIDEGNCCDECICLVACPIASACTVVGAACDVVTCPVPASYVCCNAECTRKCYRHCYESNVLKAVGVKRKE